MKNLQIVSAAFLTAAVLNAPAANAVPRTFVSGAIGVDSNTSFNCTKNRPCRTFSAAYTVTDEGGEIVVLDSANYNPVTITKSVTIIAPEGVEGSIQVPASGTGINVAAGFVVIRNLVLTSTASSATGTTGINHTAGSLVVFGATLSGLNVGMASTARSSIIGTNFWNNDFGLRITGAGCTNTVPPGCSTTAARLVGGNFVENDIALHSIDATTGKSNILQWTTDSGSTSFSTRFVGNGTGFFADGLNPGLDQMLPFYGIN